MSSDHNGMKTVSVLTRLAFGAGVVATGVLAAVAAHAHPAAPAKASTAPGAPDSTATTTQPPSADQNDPFGGSGSRQGSGGQDSGSQDRFDPSAQGGDQGFQAPPGGGPSAGGGRRGHAGSGGS